MHQRFATELGLTPAQMAQVDSIMGRSMAERHALEDSIRPRMRGILDSTRSQIERVLTPDQRQKFEAWRSRNRGPS
jgi:Spy/CpxP family protein refolding chaperone